MIHFFDTEIAEAYGVNCAILLNNIYYWCLKNEANEVNFKDGKYWTHNSIKAMCQLFPYMTKDSIQYAIKKLVSAGMLEEGDFNEDRRDRTKWYSMTEKSELHFGKNPASFRKIPKCIDNYIYIDSSTNNNQNNMGQKPQGESKPSASRFSPPSHDDVSRYCSERGNGIDPDDFIDFYSSKGWMIGKNKMKDWKAAVRTWERNRGFKHENVKEKKRSGDWE